MITNYYKIIIESSTKTEKELELLYQDEYNWFEEVWINEAFDGDDGVSIQFEQIKIVDEDTMYAC